MLCIGINFQDVVIGLGAQRMVMYWNSINKTFFRLTLRYILAKRLFSTRHYSHYNTYLSYDVYQHAASYIFIPVHSDLRFLTILGMGLAISAFTVIPE